VRAIRYHGGPTLRLEDIDPRPQAPGEVTVNVVACGVCGSDLHFLDGTAHPSRTPITLGHEIAGVVAVSDEATWAPGALVVVAAGVSCEQCRRCREGRFNLCEHVQMTGIDFDGGWAEQIVVPARALIPRPVDLDPAAAAVAADAGATAFNAIARRGEVKAGTGVAIIGIGGLGSFATQIAKLLGAAPIVAIDVDTEALELATALGADEVIDATAVESVGREVKLLTEGGVGVAAEFVGAAATVDAAVKSLRRGGIAIAAGIGNQPLVTIPPTLWAMSEYELRGSFGSLPGDTELVLEWLAAGDLQPPPLRRVRLDEAADTITAAAAGNGGRARLVVEPQGVP
jgi:D-arabinose 1-dehydrogenase-like Zn-dependent alcohol dehydrogenase